MLPAAALSGTASPDRSYESMRQTLQDTQKRCELMLTRVQKESEVNRGLSKAREAAEETSRKLADQVNQLTDKVSEAIRQKGKAEEQLEDVQKRCQIETDLREKDCGFVIPHKFKVPTHAEVHQCSTVDDASGMASLLAVLARAGVVRKFRGKGDSAVIARQRGIFDRPDYYDRVFGDLEQGEFLEWYNVDLQDLRPILDTHSARRVLDLGCGTSRLPVQLAHARPAPRLVVGCDASAAAIARQRGTVMQSRTPGQSRLLFVVADAARLPFRNGYFDLIIEKGFLDALHSTRLGEQQVHAVLTEAWRALAAGGSLISVSQHGQLTPPDERLQLFKEAKLQPLPQATREVGRIHNRGLVCVEATKPKKVQLSDGLRAAHSNCSQRSRCEVHSLAGRTGQQAALHASCT
ncbi:CSKMT [Symbiodinium necroappetens]|uniref:CSKMT protein n=1 Tax=Symbiodinium necroappetens TaxID=1628268 RepID=A0A812TZX9_9DINO|nr:CSKMT [Symbiodinium necroappetens]